MINPLSSAGRILEWTDLGQAVLIDMSVLAR
jgi:hypothetical protein